MSDDVIQQLVEAVREGTFQPDAFFYFIIFVVMLIATGFGSYLASYLSHKGQNLATKEDFQELLDQQRQSTEVTEQIRAEIEASFGERKELKARLRDKMEELMQVTIKLDSWVDDVRGVAFDGRLASVAKSPLAKINALTSLYFPLIESERSELALAHGGMMDWLFRLAQESLSADAENRDPDHSSFVDGFEPVCLRFRHSLDAFRTALVARYSPLIRVTMHESEEG